MKRAKSIKKYVESSSESENEKPIRKKTFANEFPNIPKHYNDESSSESDIENYFLKPEKINLDSQFFNTNLSDFDKVEKNILSGVTKLSDSDSDTVEEKEYLKIHKGTIPEVHPYSRLPSKMDFAQLQDYTTKIEEAKRQIEIYKAKKQAEENKTDIRNLLAAGEGKLGIGQDLKPADLHSSDVQSSDSDEEGWQEIKSKTIQENEDKNILPQKTLQITVDMPVGVKKKKGIDLVAAMKRRLNRIRKENQILVHKVHLLCWLAHGNYVNSAVNNTEILARALSVLPSEQCYPSDRVDVSYLEQIVRWYKRTVRNIEKPVPEGSDLDQCLQLQISKKEAYNKKMLVVIFVAILRSLGIQSRIVMSLQVEPLRPPMSELHIVGSKLKEKKEIVIQPSVSNISTSTAKQSKTKNASKHNMTKILIKESRSKKESETGTISKSRPIRTSALEKNVTDVNTASKATSSKPDLIDKDVVTNINFCKSREEAEKEATKNKDFKNKEKILEVKTDRRKSTRFKTSADMSQNSLATVRRNEFNSVNHSEFMDTKMLGTDINIKKIGNYTTPKRSANLEPKDYTSPLVPTKKQKSNNAGKNDTKSLSSNNLKERASTEKVSVKGKNFGQGSTKKTKSESIKNTLQNHKTKIRTRSTGSKDSVSSIKTNSRTKSKEIKIDKKLRSSRKNISQVDGLNDSDSDVEKILQLDGANDTIKKSKGSISSSGKISKRSMKYEKAQSSKKVSETDSESEFEPTSRSPVNRKLLYIPLQKYNLKMLTTEKRLSESEFEPTSRSPVNRKLLYIPLQKYNSKKLTTEKRLSSARKQYDVRNDAMDLVKGRISRQKQMDQSRLTKAGKQNLQNDSDSDYAPPPIKKKYHESDDDFLPKTKVKKRVQAVRKCALSESDNDLEKNKKIGNDVWVEVFLEAEEKWISVDVIYGQIHCLKEIYQRATHPVSYVISWDNNNKVKDVTQRYCPNFNTVTRKQRVDPKWWSDSLKPFLGILTARDKEEDDDLARQQLDQPLPKAISEYKNHPLYALKRHLLKFEALYPSEPPTLGFIRGEAVYPRSCVHTLHSRDIWLKQAKVVKLGEQSYKIVTQPKYDKLSNKIITGQVLDIFGSWQVQDYEPPTAENGIVPKNAFGNVDLFKLCMLPKGCVHLKLPGLNKIARKMNIDIAAAIVGFDFHGGWCHPMYDGFVVCKEYEDQLISCWELEQDELQRKEEEKINKRVYGNWKKLIKGLLIRERLKAKYDFGESSSSNVKDKRNKAKRTTHFTK